MKELQKKIGYEFSDIGLLRTALTHSSYANERKNVSSYERLEFLGDSILGFVTAEYLYGQEPHIPEGRMTKLRAELVCEQNLHEVAVRLGFGRCMRLGKSAEKTGGRERTSVLADMVESVIAAIYLDSGLDEAKRFIMTHILNRADISEYHTPADYKSELQEYMQRDGDCSIVYEEISETGPDHDKRFTFRVLANGVLLGTGTGRRKKDAERAAAEEALERLRK